MYAFPMLINFWMLSSFLFFINDDSIMYNLSLDREEEALRLIKKIYHPSENHEEILKTLKGQCFKRTENVEPWCTAVFGK